jgi:hypothetical protein
MKKPKLSQTLFTQSQVAELRFNLGHSMLLAGCGGSQEASPSKKQDPPHFKK